MHPRRGSGCGQQRAVVLGLHRGGLALVRALARSCVPVEGITTDYDFGSRSRYLRHRHFIHGESGAERSRGVLATLRELARSGRLVLFPDNDDGVEFILEHWEEVREVADVPLPDDPDTVQRLRRKELLPLEAAKAGIPVPKTALAGSEEAVRATGLHPPLLVKPVEGKVFVSIFKEKAFLAHDVDAAVACWRRAHEREVETVIQELIPDCQEHIYSLFTYIGQRGEALASVVGRKFRQLPVDFGSSTVFEARWDPRIFELGMTLLRSAGYRGFAHVEFALDRRDGAFKLIEVNTRVPVWASIAMRRDFDIASAAYRDLCGLHTGAGAALRERVCWIDLRRDVTVLVRRPDLGLREFFVPYLARRRARAYFAADDPMPGLACLWAARRRALGKLGRAARRHGRARAARSPA